MISSTESTNNSLSALSSAYVETQKTEDPLGRDAFLTMLVAQLEHQDPLNPLEGTDFTAQLAQFSSLEQQFAINDNLEAIKEALDSQSEPDLMQYIGKEVSGSIQSMDVYDGIASGGGSFSLSAPTSVAMAIYDENGAEVRRMNLGQLDAGDHTVIWNGKDNDNSIVDDGTYSYEVIALNDNGGYSYQLSTTVSGEVDGIVYKDGVGYLMIGSMIVNPSSIVEISQAKTAETDSAGTDATTQTTTVDEDEA
ncbi:MAG: flagellar hook assembly protein FlgD [Proteobacteria bacterium]|nr:flagellar hook assembly protein FlgD [Pseudomonadota bacterium]